MTKEEADTDTAEPVVKKKRSLSKLLAIVLLPLAVGGGALFWWSGTDAGAEPLSAEAEQVETDAADDEPQGVVALTPFVANLADPGGRSFLRASISVLVAQAEEADRITGDAVIVTRLRAAILDVLSHQTAGELLTPTGKSGLEATLAAQVREILTTVEEGHVLITEFVVQR